MLLNTKQIASLIFALVLVYFPVCASAETTYTGVATCASSNCHGDVSPKQATNVLQSEYTTWFRHDAHSRAYQTLLSEDSKIIGKHLGIANPEQSEQCLACHSTFVPKEQRGERFRLSDGVGCESCHGAAGKYLSTHRVAHRKHEENLSDGLRNLYDLEVRAQVCLECHQGNDSQYVDHRLIGAGHPRLTFELDTYSILQPNHWRVDADYIERKGDYQPIKAWLVGQSLRVKEMIRTLRSKKRSTYGAMPELSNYYCGNCHHSLSEKQWRTRDYEGTPGELHLNISSLVILREALREFDSSLSEQLAAEIAGLHKAHQQGEAAEQLKQLELLTDRALALLAKNISISEELSRNILRRIVSYAAKSKFLPYEIAEQCVMAMSALRAQLDPSGKLYQKQLDALYDTLKDENNFNPQHFMEAAKNFNVA